MNNSVFLSEIHDYIDSSYREYEKYQKTAGAILRHLHVLFEKEGIHYFLMYGTLLGAVRDGGHIPWDYDEDIAVPADEREKLIRTLENGLGDEYYYASPENVKNYPACCIRVSKKGYSFNAVHIDIFFITACPDEEKKCSRFIRKLDRAALRRGRKYSRYWFPRNLGGGMLERIVATADRVRSSLITESALERGDKLLSRYSLGQTKYCHLYGVRGECFLSEWFDGRAAVTIDGFEFYAPSGYEEILSYLFGDYMKYPPLGKRFEEFYTALGIIRERNSAYGGKKGE